MTFNDILAVSLTSPGHWFTRKEALGLWAIRIGHPHEKVLMRAKREGKWSFTRVALRARDFRADDWMVTTEQVFE